MILLSDIFKICNKMAKEIYEIEEINISILSAFDWAEKLVFHNICYLCFSSVIYEE